MPFCLNQAFIEKRDVIDIYSSGCGEKNLKNEIGRSCFEMRSVKMILFTSVLLMWYKYINALQVDHYSNVLYFEPKFCLNQNVPRHAIKWGRSTQLSAARGNFINFSNETVMYAAKLCGIILREQFAHDCETKLSQNWEWMMIMESRCIVRKSKLFCFNERWLFRGQCFWATEQFPRRTTVSTIWFVELL